MSTVSIITLTYNRASMIGKTIECVLKQSHADFQYIIVDDGSGDNTEDVVKQYNDLRIHYYKLPHSGSISHLRNFGISKSTSGLVAFIDSDDLWSKEKLAVQIEVLGKNPSVGFVFTDVVLLFQNGEKKNVSYLPSAENEEAQNYFPLMIRDKLPVYPSTLLFKKECLAKVGQFNASLPAGDTNFITRLMYHYPGIHLCQSLVSIKKHETNHSEIHTIDAHHENLHTLHYFREKKLIGNFLYRRKSAFHHRALANKYNTEGNTSKAMHHFKKGLALNPADVKNIASLFAMQFNTARKHE